MNQLDAGKRVRRLREQRAWTQEHLAQAAGISLRTVQRAEEGAMSAETLSALAAAFDRPVTELTRPESAYPSVTPFLYYDEPGSFDWLVKVFGFAVRMKIPGPGGVVVHGELTIGDGMIMVGTSSEAGDAKTPKQSGCRTQGVYVMVEDVDAHCAHARSAGAKILCEPQEAHGHRRYLAEDPEGHQWWFASELSR